MDPSPGHLDGRTLGPYTNLARIGAGGMGEVYRAHDPRLRRDVAIKVLPADVAADPTALARFRREARAVAALSHPNILSIYEFDVEGQVAYAVAELLEGETLRQRIRRGPLALREALAIAVDTCAGLAAAHAHGIVHRDIKPENLFVTASGAVKVLDFGLARPAAALATSATTVTTPGVVVGTVGYMSPEQIRGEPAAPATDIFSFGCVLYEMFRGVSPFDRPTAAETISAILRDDPPSLVEQVPGLPASLEALVLHCLEKQPRDRFQSTADLLFALRAAQLSLRRTSGAVEGVAVSPPPRMARWVPWALVAVLAAAGLALLASWPRNGVAPGRSEQFRQLTFEHGLVSNARFGAEGRNVIFSASWDGRPSQIFVRLLDQLDAVPTGPPDAHLLAASASGELAIRMSSIQNAAFGSEGTLARMPALGGAPRQLAVAVAAADWMGGDGSLAIVTDSDDRQRLDCGNGTSPYETRGWISDLRAAPRGSLVAFLEHTSRDAFLGHIVVYDCRNGARREFVRQRNHFGLAWHPQTGEIWFGSHGGLRAVNLDTGAERTVLPLPESVRLHDIAADGRALLSHETQRMRMAVARLPDGDARDLSWLSWSLVTGFTPDGKNVVFSEFVAQAGSEAIAAVRAIDGSGVVRLGEGFVLGASPDGRWVMAVGHAAPGPSRIMLLPLAAGEPRTLPAHGVHNHEMGTFLPDGQHVVFIGREEGQGNRLYRQPIAGGPPTPISAEGVGLSAVVASPDGAYVAANLQDGPWLFPLAGGEPRAIPGVGRGHLAAGWSRDSCCVYIRDMTREVTLRRVNVATGVAQRVAVVRPPDLSGVVWIGPLLVSPDESTAAFSYFRSLSSLYLVTGLH